MTIANYKHATIRLKGSLDVSQPELAAEITEGYGRVVIRVRVTGKHPVWTGAELGKDHFKIVSLSERP